MSKEQAPMTEVPGEAHVADTTTQPLPWYTLNPRAVGRSRMIRALAVGLVIVSFSALPLWRLFWFLPVYSAGVFLPVRDTRNHFHAAWHWIDGKEIRIYQVAGVRPGMAEEIKAGVEAMVQDVGLDFTVKVLPIPQEIQAAYDQALIRGTINGTSSQLLVFSKLQARLIELRQGDPHADILVVNAPLHNCWWAHGLATFSSGVSIMQEANVRFHLGKHETGHLLGYHYHDSLPLFVFGYPWEGLPWQRDSLMMLYGESDTLSPRSRDALHYFWRGLEVRSGRQYLQTAATSRR